LPMSKTRVAASVLLLAALPLLSSCTKDPKAAASSPPTTEAPATTVTTAPVIAPLTGLVDPTGAAAGRAALVVKIENAPEARPQSGLDVADVVYEEVVEGGITRFLAVFQSGLPDGTDDTLGPIRSVRPMDPSLATPLHPLFAYAGGTQAFVGLLHHAPVQDVGFDTATDAYWRAKSRRAPHNLFARASLLWSAAKASFRTPPPALFSFLGAGVPFGGTASAGVTIGFSPASTASYTWDAASATWKRAENGTAHVVASGTQIAPVNVVVMVVREQTLHNTDPAGTHVPEAVTTGAGDAWVFSQGRVEKGRWTRPSVNAPAVLTDAAGTPIALTPGRTWVHLAPVGAAVTVH